MKYLIVFAFALASASAFGLRSAEIESRSIVVPVVKQEGRITNGNTASESDFPHQVLLLLKLNASYNYCGGSLIGHEWLLTAAHCLDGIESADLILGATDATSPVVVFTVLKDSFIIHFGWNSKNYRNDIALVKMPRSVAYSFKIQAVRLPAIANSYSTYAGHTAIASGWGKTSDEPNSGTNNLQWAPFKVITNSECAKTYGTNVTESNICISTPNGVAPCRGDSGGPLVLEPSNILIGVTSYGVIEACTMGHPTAFIRLTGYLDWIKSNTGISY